MASRGNSVHPLVRRFVSDPCHVSSPPWKSRRCEASDFPPCAAAFRRALDRSRKTIMSRCAISATSTRPFAREVALHPRSDQARGLRHQIRYTVAVRRQSSTRNRGFAAPDAAPDGIAGRARTRCCGGWTRPESRKFTPHVTLARLRHSSRATRSPIIFPCAARYACRCRADRFGLFSSRDSVRGGGDGGSGLPVLEPIQPMRQAQR